MTPRVKILLAIGLLLIGGTQAYFSGLEPDETDFTASQPNMGQNVSSNDPSKAFASIAFSLPSSKESVTLATPRNIFAPLGEDRAINKKKVVARRPPPPPPPKPSPPIVPKPSLPAPVQPPRQNLEQKARIKAEQEMNRYRFLGYLERAGEQHVFLSNGQALYIVKQGEVVEGTIKLKAVEDTSVVLSKVLPGMGSTAEATLQLIKDAEGT